MKSLFILCIASVLALNVRAQIELVQTGGTFRTDDTNFATSGTAFSSGEIGVSPHATTNLNDGNYGNSSSWIGSGASSAGIVFGSVANLSAFAFGRDNTGNYSDRSLGLYNFYYTTDSGLNSSNALSATWTSIGSLNYTGSTSSPSQRHLYNLSSTISNATGFRVDSDAGVAIDEIELYSTQAEVVRSPGISTLNTPTWGYQTAPANRINALPFATDSFSDQYLVTGATLVSYLSSTGVTDFTVSLAADSGSGTPGDILGTFTGPNSPGAGNLDFTTDGILVDGGTNYWLQYSFSDSGGTYYATAINSIVSSGDWTTELKHLESDNGGDSWYTNSGNTHKFAITATAVPEPSTYAAILGLGALGFVAWHRRRKVA